MLNNLMFFTFKFIEQIRMPTVRAKFIQWAEDLLNLSPGMAHQIAHWHGGDNNPLTIVMRDTPPRAGLRIFVRHYKIMQYLQHSLNTDRIGLGYV